MTARDDRPAREGNVREAILRAASRLFAYNGYHATTTRKIAEKVGVKQPAIFHHFASKAEIMEALQRVDLLDSIEFYRRAARQDPAPAVQLYVGLHGEVMHLLVGPYDFRGTSTWAVLNDPAFVTARNWWSQLVLTRTSLVAKSIGSGVFIDIDPTFAGNVIEATLDGALMAVGTLPAGSEAEWAHELVSLMVRSLLADQNDLESIRKRAMVALEDPATARTAP